MLPHYILSLHDIEYIGESKKEIKRKNETVKNKINNSECIKY